MKLERTYRADARKSVVVGMFKVNCCRRKRSQVSGEARCHRTQPKCNGMVTAVKL